MAAVTVRNLDAQVKERLRIRAAVHGRSMESEIRAILAEAVSRPGDTDELFATMLDRFAQILYGIARLPDGRRKQLLSTTSSELFAALQDQVLPFDSAAARHYSEVVQGRDQRGSRRAEQDHARDARHQERADPDRRRYPEQQKVHAGRQLLGLPQWQGRGRAASLLGGTRGGRDYRDAAREGWGDTLGMCTDRFSVNWLVNINAAQPQGG